MSRPSGLIWGIIWRSVLWYTVAGVVLGGLYGCVTIAVAMFSADAGEAIDPYLVWASRASIGLFGVMGFVGGWAVARAIGREMRPLLGAVNGGMAGVQLGGFQYMFAYFIAFPFGAILGGTYGLAVGIVNAILVAALTRVLFYPLSEPLLHRRALAWTSLFGVLLLPGFWFVTLIRSSGYAGVGGLTGSFWGDFFVYAGFPSLILALVAQWFGGRLSTWYETAAPSTQATVEEPALRRALRRDRPNAVEAALGDALEWGIQHWVGITGRRVCTAQAPWLGGPVGSEYVGAGFYGGYAREEGLEAVADEDAGLLTDFGELTGEEFDPSLVDPEIRDFYERTARYYLDVQIRWSGPFKHPPRTLIYLVGRNIGQFDIPLSPSTVTMKNELIHLRDPATNETPYAGWLRRSAATGDAMLAGLYTTCGLPLERGRLFKGIYPLPGGSATTIFRPENRPDGSFSLVSDGRRFGEAGYYRIHRTDGGALRVRRVPIEERLHVSVDPNSALRARHEFAFCGVRFLTLHYEISRRA